MRYAFFAPECLQLSSIDCGVAAVSCLLSGYGVEASYDELREACQTGVDGTSIDSLEDLCTTVGIHLVQHVVPADLVFSMMEGRLPLIAVFTGNGGLPHFVTVWRRLGRYFQVMDPASGRRWVRREELLRSLYVHEFRLVEADWRLWMSDNSFRAALVQRSRNALTEKSHTSLVSPVLERLVVEELSALDAALRLTSMAQESKACTGRVEGVFPRVFEAARSDASFPDWLRAIERRGDEVLTHGAVLLAPSTAYEPPQRSSREQNSTASPLDAGAVHSLPADERSTFGEVTDLLGSESRALVAALAAGAVLLALLTAAELLVFRVALDAPRLLATLDSKLSGGAFVVAFALIFAGLEATLAYARLSLGRRAEIRLRRATLFALPRVNDRFVRSRPITDFAYRAHNLTLASQLPGSMFALLRGATDLIVTGVAIGCLGLAYLPPVAGGCLLLTLTLVAARSRLAGLDGRNQVHASRLLTLFRDALQGARPIRLHGYQDAFRAEQQREIRLWRLTGAALVKSVAWLELVAGGAGCALVVGVLWMFAQSSGDVRVFVLLALWAFRLPSVVKGLVLLIQEYPVQAVALRRLLEITRHARLDEQSEQAVNPRTAPGASNDRAGVALELRNVSVVLNDYPVLNNVSLICEAGEHIAVVGRSGSGKSSLAGVLLGFLSPTHGELRFDEQRPDILAWQSLLRRTVWVDPGNQLWDATIRENIDYSVAGLRRRPLLEAAQLSDLLGVLDHMEMGLETRVDPEGTNLSGGEGQRIRLARGMRRADVSLVVLDEAFRGLEREERERLLGKLRAAFSQATLLFISHDIATAQQFSRVLVLDEGRVVEDGSPAELAARASHFAQLLQAEQFALQELWSARHWRELRVGGGNLSEISAERPHG